MVGQFEAGDFAMRNVLLVTVADEETVVLVDLARAFGLVAESVRRIRKLVKEEGLVAVVNRHYVSRGAWKVTPAMERKVASLFAKGLNQKEARTKLKGALSAGTLNKLHQKWKAATAEAEAAATVRAKEGPRQPELSFEPEPALEREVATVTEPPSAPVPVAEATKPDPAEASVSDAVEPAVTGALEAKKEESGYVVADDGGEVDGRTLLLRSALVEGPLIQLVDGHQATRRGARHRGDGQHRGWRVRATLDAYVSCCD
jgi:hypothetical protein